ncbi:MAG: GNAT family N-acetyltransferase [Anaerolineae bacterium]|nr:GNAT family N-acetyltransferase [Anaerolineae bacterium]
MITVRAAQLEDSERIAALAQGQVSAWQRWDVDGRVEDVPYSMLTIYERWLHGGPWMSLETAAIHMGRLLLGAGIALVAETDGMIAGYAEAYAGNEPEPFGAHIHLGGLIVQEDAHGQGVDGALYAALVERARSLKCARMTTTATAGEAALMLFQRAGAEPVAKLQRFSLAARTGQGLYQAVPETTTDAQQIAGWAMPAGRSTSAREQWETLWQPTWDALPELRERTTRLRFSASGHEAFVVFQRGLFDPRRADVYCWSPRGLSAALLMALRDWAHREGYRSLTLLVLDSAAKALGTEAEADGYVQDVLSLEV